MTGNLGLGIGKPGIEKMLLRKESRMTEGRSPVNRTGAQGQGWTRKQEPMEKLWVQHIKRGPSFRKRIDMEIKHQ